MKKIALLLALVMTLGVASVASAAEITTSGEVYYGLIYGKLAPLAGEDAFLLSDDLGFKLQFGAKVSDQVSATLRYRADKVGGDGDRFDKAYVTLSNFGLPLTVDLGRNTVVNDPGFGFDGFGMIGGANNGVSIKTDSFNGFSGQVVGTVGNTMGNNLKAAIANYSADFGSFALIAKPVSYLDEGKVIDEVNYDADDEYKDGVSFAVSANVPVPSTPVKALVEYISYADTAVAYKDSALKNEVKAADFSVGAEATLAGVDTYVKYFTLNNNTRVDVTDLTTAYTSKITAGVSKEINGATYSVDLETYTSLSEGAKDFNETLVDDSKIDDSAMSLTFGVTVAF